MSEVEFVSKKIKIGFEGVFSLKDLYRTIDKYFFRFACDKKEVQSTEATKKDGKTIHIKTEYDRKFNDYVREYHEIKINCKGVKPVDIKKGNKKMRLNKGYVEVVLDSYVKSDYETRWEGKPLYYLFRIIWHKYVWPSMLSEFKGQTKHTDVQFIAEVKAFLNLGKY